MKILVFTDSRQHNEENSLYPFLNEFLSRDEVQEVLVACPSCENNSDFFLGVKRSKVWAHSIGADFEFEKRSLLAVDVDLVDRSSIDFVWMRLPPPLNPSLLDLISDNFVESLILNNPKTILSTGSKEYLLNFPELTAPHWLCDSEDDVRRIITAHEIVLKPLSGYGGQGVIRVSQDGAIIDGQNYDLEVGLNMAFAKMDRYIAVKFLQNVSEGDKRIIVINGEVYGASLRVPKDGHWLCNVSQGGTAIFADITPEEQHMVKVVDEHLSAAGIFMYGIDTLVGDHGKRVLSEINTASIGGLPQMAKFSGLNLLERAVSSFLAYYRTVAI